MLIQCQIPFPYSSAIVYLFNFPVLPFALHPRMFFKYARLPICAIAAKPPDRSA